MGMDQLGVIIKSVKSSSKSKSANIGRTHPGQFIPKEIQDLNVKGTIFNGCLIKYDLAQNLWYYAADAGSTCADIVNCIESAATLDLSDVDVTLGNIFGAITFDNSATVDFSNIVVTLGEIAGDITFSANTTIDRTNTTNTGTQEFDNNYIANYTGSTINYTGVIVNYDITSTILYNGVALVPLAVQAGGTLVSETSVIDFIGTGVSSVTRDPILSKIVVDISGGGTPMTCSDVIDCVEAATAINFGGNITFQAGTTIDWTNTTNSGTQNFTNTYEANYDGSTINITNGSTFNIEDSTYNSTNNTYQYTGDVINYDVTSTVTIEGDTNITNLTVTNLTLPAGNNIIVNGSWKEETFDSSIPTGDTCLLALGTPLDVNAIFVFKKDSGLTRFQTLDYTFDALTNTVTLVTPLVPGEEVLIKYMIGSSSVVAGVKKVDGVVRTGPTNQLVITDLDCTTGSVVMGWTVTAGSVVGFRQRTVGAGSITIDSTGSESGITLNYVLYI